MNENERFDAYLSALQRDPHALPPAGMSERDIRLAREMLKLGASVESTSRDRVWKRAQQMAQRDRYPSQSTQDDGESKMTVQTLNQPAVMRRLNEQPKVGAQMLGLLTLAAAITLVLFSVVYFGSGGDGSSGDDPGAGMAAQPEETEAPTQPPTPPPTGTPVPVQSPGAVLEFAPCPDVNGTIIVPTVPPPDSTATSTPFPSTALPVTATPIAISQGTVDMEAVQLVPCELRDENTLILEGEPTAIPPIGTSSTVEVVVEEGDTLTSLLVTYDLTLPVFAALNPQLNFEGCDFSRISGGSTCRIELVVGDTLMVPNYDISVEALPVVTATPFPTSDGD